MTSIQGYKCLEVLFKDPSKALFRAERTADGASVLLKLPSYTSSDAVRELDNELSLRPGFTSDCMVPILDKLNVDNLVLLEMAGVRGVTLESYLAHHRPSLADALQISVQLARLVEELHSHVILHRDIRPANVLIDTDTLSVTLWDLGVAVHALSAGKSPNLARKFETALEYISPEQSGRTEMAEDHRSDLYSLGITLYRVLTGRLPFEQTDINELVHAHIAKQPAAAGSINAALPAVVSEIIAKLLQKKPGDRYKNARSLRLDLQECYRQYTIEGHVRLFTPDAHVLTDTIRINTHLYGREAEINKALAAFDRIDQHSGFILLYGNSGIGKSAVMKEIHQRLRQQDKLVLSGKCDERNRHTPFGILVLAFRELITELREDQPAFQAWRDAVASQLGPEVGILTDIIPELASLFGERQRAAGFAPADAQKRVTATFAKFIEATATRRRPLVILLDDLQWADAASLDLLQMLVCTSCTRHVLVVGTYRDNEVHANDPLAVMLQTITQHAPENFQHLRLLPLTLEEVCRLLADTLASNTHLTRPLADYLLTGTLGNPLFISERLQELRKKSLITFNPDAQRWTWCMENILHRSRASSSLELITERIQRLPRVTQQALVYGACIGRQFDLSMLAALMDKTDHEAADDLKEALQENLILPAPATRSPDTLLPRTRYIFFHDQVQQAACALIPPRERQELHLTIGYFLLDKLSDDEVDRQLFDIVHHLNLGSALITEAAARYTLAGINLRAGRKAKQTTAYRAAYTYYDAGLALLNHTAWATDYTLCLSLHVGGGEAAYLAHDREASEALLGRALGQVKTEGEKIRIHEIQIQALVFQCRNSEAIALGLQVLRSLKVTFPASYSTARLLLAYAGIKWTLRRHTVEDLPRLPAMVDEGMLAAMRIMQSISAVAYHNAPGLYPLLVLKMMRLSVTYGSATESPLAYATYGAMVNGIETNNGVCYRFGKAALTLLEKNTDAGIGARTLLIYNLINRPSHEHVHESLDELKRCFKNASDLGDVEYATYASNGYCMLLCLSGKSLWWVKEEMLRCNILPPALRMNDASYGNDALIQLVANLGDENDDPTVLTGKYFDEGTGFAEILRANKPSKLFACYVFKMMLCYFVGDYAGGKNHIANARRYLHYSRGQILEAMFYFYAALLRFAAYRHSAQARDLRQGKAYTRKINKWASQVPVNCAHLSLLAEAEHARVTGKKDQALTLYDQAIQAAQRSNYIQHEALAHELAAACWKEKGQKHMERIYLTSALDAYKKWGCTLKVKRLEEQREGYDLADEQTSSGHVMPSLDITTIMKASTALSSEVVFDQLLDKLMKFVIENAGAQAGYFILDWSGKLYIEARQSVNDQKSARLQILLAESDLIPQAIVEHVFRSKEDVVLADAQLDPVFAHDAAVMKHRVRSALCIPALNQGKLVGALYLENNLTTGAFTKDRVELLKLLSGQIAVSIENSILYENLEQKVQERTAEIQVQKEEIERQKQLVEQKSKFKEQFFANMSHEIRTPMTAIIGMSELIFDTPLTLQQMEYAKGIKYSSENLLAIINDILDFSKIEAGKFSFVQKPFQLRERIHRLHAMVGVLADEKNIALSMEVDASIPQQLIGDPLRLHQILLNLVGNAIKFTERGHVSVTVNPVESNESHVVLSFAVRDSGIGIAEDKLHYIFETFSRIEDELNLQHAGTGLGLFIAKKLVEEQGGSMTVTSKLQEGTTFRFTLPFQRCDASVQEEDKDTVSLSDLRILLVEDTLFNQVVAEEILKKIITNAQVIVADNGQVALEKLEHHVVDIILMDIKMPVMDGYTASRHIRAMQGLERVPILAFTSNANPGEADKCKAAGMDDYITKPIESRKLKQKIARLLQGAGAPVEESGW